MRAIDADALQLAIVEEGQANKRKKYIIGDIWELTGAEIREVINSQPTIQPEIVRCKDCRYYNSEEKECLDLLGHGRRWEEDDFCSYAERGDNMTKEKVIDILEGIKYGTACLMPNMPEDGEKAIDIAIKAVEQFEPHWIPVTEEPIPDGEYLVTWTSEIQEKPILSIVCRYSEMWDCWELQLLGHHDINILAYMPLPEPYKG